MSTFRVGQKVVCVNRPAWVAYGPQVGDHIKVVEAYPCPCCTMTMLRLDGYGHYGFGDIYFRPIEEADLTASLASSWKESVPVEQEIVNVPQPQHA